MGNPISVLKRGRQTIQVYHNNFEYYQPNTHKCGDCAIRAVAKALDVSWEEALTLLYNTSRVVHEDPISTKTIGETLKFHGFAWKGFKPEEGGKRPTSPRNMSPGGTSSAWPSTSCVRSAGGTSTSGTAA